MTRHLSVVTPLQEWANHIAEVARASVLGTSESETSFELCVSDEDDSLIVLIVFVEIIDTKSKFTFGLINEHGEPVGINVKKDADGNLIATLP